MEQEVTQANVLISLLVRFPQIGAVHYEPQEKALRFVFVLEKALAADFQDFCAGFKAHLALFHNLQQDREHRLSLKKLDDQRFSMLEVTRDVFSLSLEEVNLMIQLVGDYYGESLVLEGPIVDEELEFEHNVLIESRLSLGFLAGAERLSGFRENGRVLVFSTPLTGVGRS